MNKRDLDNESTKLSAKIFVTFQKGDVPLDYM